MWQMVKSCDRSQRRLAVFLVVVVVMEVYAISRIIDHEHQAARADKLHGGKRTTVSSAEMVKALTGDVPRNKTSKLLGVSRLQFCPVEDSDMAGPAKPVEYGHMNVHFSFGNDTGKRSSSYQTDFGTFNTGLYKGRSKVPPPVPAEIMPHVNKSIERQKWLTSTMRDFASFEYQTRSHAYQTSRGGFIDTKEVHNKNADLLRENFTPVTSNYVKDFQKPGVGIPGLPEHMSLTRAALKKIIDKRENNISEARHAFQWPHKERVKVPLHLRNLRSK